ncbi:anti-virulence regulator CigR family protein [Elioraea sp.]|uniref:anti-virulence regulator CigR family protein n=1 Tax=Elioraea sp. TaxID=2185103 RepID=UPI0025C6D5AD|nr:anti-virulence regulator CigR family protein [Elioraea sp.]
MRAPARRAVLAAFLATLSWRAQAQGQGQGQGQRQNQNQGPSQGQGQGQAPNQGRGGAQVPTTFSTTEQARITAWLAANAGSLQPLPPGIARNLARGKPLPPGIARRAAPQTLLSQLILRPGYEVLVIGTAVVLAQVGNQLVQDLVEGAGRGR